MRGLVFLKVKVKGQTERQYIDAQIVTPRDVELAFVEDEIQRERDRQYAERVMDRVRSARLANNFMSLNPVQIH